MLGLTIAAGGIVFRPPDHILIVHRHRYDDWSLPKGKQDAGETVLQTALREVREETGYAVRPIRLFGASAYEVQGEPKVVLYWLMELADPGAEPEAVDASEVSQALWLPWAEAAQRLTYDSERELLARKVTL